MKIDRSSVAKLARASRTLLSVSALALGIGAATLACGGDRDERGLAPKDEESTPESSSEMKMTEEQRREQAMQQEQAKEREEFNDAEGQDQSAPE